MIMLLLIRFGQLSTELSALCPSLLYTSTLYSYMKKLASHVWIFVLIAATTITINQKTFFVGMSWQPCKSMQINFTRYSFGSIWNYYLVWKYYLVVELFIHCKHNLFVFRQNKNLLMTGKLVASQSIAKSQSKLDPMQPQGSITMSPLLEHILMTAASQFNVIYQKTPVRYLKQNIHVSSITSNFLPSQFQQLLLPAQVSQAAIVVAL